MNIAAADERDIVYRRDDKYVKWDRCIVRDKNGKTLWGSCYYRLRRGSALSFSFNEKGGRNGEINLAAIRRRGYDNFKTKQRMAENIFHIISRRPCTNKSKPSSRRFCP